MSISTAARHPARPRLLIIDSDETVIVRLSSVFDRRCLKPVQGDGHRIDATHPQWCRCRSADSDVACSVVARSLPALHALDLHQADVAICSTMLHDATGLDALAYIRGIRPDLPVILIGPDASLAVEAIRGGALDFLVATHPRDLHTLPLAVEKAMAHQRIKLEHDHLHHDMRKSLAELAVTNHKLQDLVRQLESISRTDELTGLCNRRSFNELLHRSWTEAVRHDVPLACVMIDLDRFKSVNDRLGHHRGDELLQMTAKAIRANCREVDVASRYGGDEFCILMTHTQAEEAAIVAERIKREFEYAVRSRPDGTPQVTLSVGISHINLSRPINALQLVTHADEAMYAAKAAGKSGMMIRGESACFAPASRSGPADNHSA